MADRSVLTPALTEQDRDAAALDNRYVWRSWSPIKQAQNERLLIDRGEGYHVWDTAGRRYVDAVAGAMNSSCGYGEKRLIDAATQQLSRLPHYDQIGGGHSLAGSLGERLAGLLPGDLHRTFFTNSGSEAAEAAVRIAVNYWNNVGVARRRLVTFEAGYHGTTAMAQALSGLPAALPDLPFGIPITHVSLPVPSSRMLLPETLSVLVEQFAQAIRGDSRGEDVAAVIVEPFLNVGGGVCLPPGFLRELRRLCDEAGTMLVLDEVFTGFGRLGRMFGFERDEVVPDIVMMSKGISSGYMPLGAVTTTGEVFDSFALDPVFGGLRYGHTTSGHAAACAVALATLNVLEEDGLVGNASARGKELILGLTPLIQLPGIVDVRGEGLAVVLEVNDSAEAFRLMMLARSYGVLLKCQNRSLLVIPPLMIDRAGIEELVDGIVSASREFSLTSGREVPVASEKG